MNKRKKEDDVARLMKELEVAKAQQAVTVAEQSSMHSKMGFWRVGKIFNFIWKRPMIVLMTILLILLVTLPFITFFLLKQGSTFTEEKGVFLERVQQLSELSTAEAYTKVIVERQDNELFGQSIGIDLPGTKRQLLVVIPGSVKAGVDLSSITSEDIKMNEETKTAQLTLPPAQFLGGAEIYFDKIEIYSYEGLFRSEADIKEGYELAEEAKKMILEESVGQGVLEAAERNAEQALKEFFSLAGYEIKIQFKE